MQAAICTEESVINCSSTIFDQKKLRGELLKRGSANVCLCIGHCHDHFGAILGDAAGLILLAHHEAHYVLQEDERDAPLCTQLYEVCPCSRNIVRGRKPIKPTCA